VGVSKRLLTIDLSLGKTQKISWCSFNPEIISSDGKVYDEEGCLSFPEIREKVTRYAKVRIRARTSMAKWFEMDGEDILSRCLQHEIDHVDGMLFIYRMSALKRDFSAAQKFARCNAMASVNSPRGTYMTNPLRLIFCGTPQFAVPTLKSARSGRL